MNLILSATLSSLSATQPATQPICFFVNQAKSPEYSKRSWDPVKNTTTALSHIQCFEMDCVC